MSVDHIARLVSFPCDVDRYWRVMYRAVDEDGVVRAEREIDLHNGLDAADLRTATFALEERGLLGAAQVLWPEGNWR